MIKSNFITNIFQQFLRDKDIRDFKDNFFYYIIFRIIRKFLSYNLIIQIYNFKVYGSINKNKTSHFLLKKCEFGDYHELDIIKKFSNANKLLFIDCGCNYGFYSLYTASLNKNNMIISIEASKNTSVEFIKNHKLNEFSNIIFFNKAVTDVSNKSISFYESVNDWESSQTHADFDFEKTTKVESINIDALVKKYDYKKYNTIIKLDIEGNEMSAIKGGLELIRETSPLIIIEFSKFIFNKKENKDYFKNFLVAFDYSIYNVFKKKREFEKILQDLDDLGKSHKTIGNYYLIKNSSKTLQDFLLN